MTRTGRTARWTIGLVVSAAGLCACAGGTADGTAALDVSGEWVFVSGTTGQGELTPPTRELPTLVLDGDRARGHTGCNGYGGEVEQAGDDLSVPEIERTLMGCAGAVGSFEEVFLSALGEVDTASRPGGALVLTGEDVSLRFEPMPAWPQEAVVGRTWRLHQLTTDRPDAEPVPAAAHVDRAADHATLYFSDHRMTGSTGCRSFTGDWTELDGVVVLAESSYSGECGHDEAAEQERWVTHVLQRFTAEVRSREGSDEMVLTSALVDADGTRRQLVYRR